MGDEEEDHCGGGGDDDYDANNDKGDRHKIKDNEDGYVVDCYNDVEYETTKICHLTAKQTLFLLQLQYILHVFGNWWRVYTTGFFFHQIKCIDVHIQMLFNKYKIKFLNC